MLNSLHQNHAAINRKVRRAYDLRDFLSSSDARLNARFFGDSPRMVNQNWFTLFAATGTYRLTIGEGDASRVLMFAAPWEAWDRMITEGVMIGDWFADQRHAVGMLTHVAWLAPSGNYKDLAQMQAFALRVRQQDSAFPTPTLTECEDGIKVRWPLIPLEKAGEL